MDTPRPLLNLYDLEEYDVVTRLRAKRLAPFFKWSQRDRVLLRLFRTVQYRNIRRSGHIARTDLRTELQDPDPYDPSYIFFCMRLKGCSV